MEFFINDRVRVKENIEPKKRIPNTQETQVWLAR